METDDVNESTSQSYYTKDVLSYYAAKDQVVQFIGADGNTYTYTLTTAHKRRDGSKCTNQMFEAFRIKVKNKLELYRSASNANKARN